MTITNKKTNKRRAIRWAVVAMLSTTAVLGVGYKASKSASAKSPGEEEVVVTRERMASTIDEVGKVEPILKIDVKSKVSGQVQEVLVDVGDTVEAGDALVRLDPTDAKHKLARAVARQHVVTASLDGAEKIASIQTGARRHGVASKLEVLRATAEVDKLRAEASVGLAEQAILRDELHYTTLTSPIEGVVIAKNIHKGEMVTPGVAAMVDGKPLLVVAQVDKLLVRVELNQLDVVRLDIGQKVDVRVDAVPDHVLEGKVLRLAHMAQKSERRKDSNLMVFPVDVVVDTRQPGAAKVRPGMMADVSVDLEAHENALVVPLEAVVHDSGKTRVWRVSGEGKSELVDVRVGLENERKAEIVSGVSEGDRVVIKAEAKKK